MERLQRILLLRIADRRIWYPCIVEKNSFALDEEARIWDSTANVSCSNSFRN